MAARSGWFCSHKDTKAQRIRDEGVASQKHRHPELGSGSICQFIPAPVVTSQAETCGCVFFRTMGAAARWTLKQVQGDGGSMVKVGNKMCCSSFLTLRAFVSLREIFPLPLRGEDTKPWPTGLGAVGEGEVARTPHRPAPLRCD